MPQPLTLAGAGSPSVIAGSKDTVGKANGARELSCSRSRWPKSACRGEQGDGHQSWNSTPGMPSPEHPRGPARDYPDPEASGQARPLAGKRPRLRIAPMRPSAQQGLTSEPRAGLGPCSLSLGELHPDAGVLLLLGEESESRGKGKAWSGVTATSLPMYLCFFPGGLEGWPAVPPSRSHFPSKCQVLASPRPPAGRCVRCTGYGVGSPAWEEPRGPKKGPHRG